VLARNHVGIVQGALYVGIVIYVLAILALFSLEETFSKEMEFDE
jgi:hypothetical protein